MATFYKFNAFVEHLAEKTHNLGTDVLKIALTDTASSPSASNSVLADLTTVSTTNISPATSLNLSPTSSAQTSGTYKLVVADNVLTAANGSVGPFRHVVIYNSSAVSPVNALIGWYDYGSSITLAQGETLTLDFDQTNGLLTLA